MNLRCRSITVLAAVAGALLVGPTGAQQHSEADIRAAFAAADRNGDGFVDIDEYVGHIILLFGTHDKNGDRYLTPDELPNHDPARFRMADRDGDGRLSLGEGVAAKVIEYFEIDRNRDGVLSIEEVLVFERARAAVK